MVVGQRPGHDDNDREEEVHPKVKQLMGQLISHFNGVYVGDILQSCGKTHNDPRALPRYVDQRGR